MTESKPDVLYVRMLGGFSVRWNGKLIAGGSKASDSQYTSLLQIQIHNREHGVTRDRLEELLFEDRDMSNVHHALQSVIYNSKKKLEKAGLPAANCIEQRKEVFFWTNEIELVGAWSVHPNGCGKTRIISKWKSLAHTLPWSTRLRTGRP